MSSRSRTGVKHRDNSNALSLQVDTASESRIQGNLELLHFLTDLTHGILKLGDVGVNLLCGCGEHGLGICEGKLEEGVSDFVTVLVSIDSVPDW
jgi:hypothetical protein